MAYLKVSAALAVLAIGFYSIGYRLRVQALRADFEAFCATSPGLACDTKMESLQLVFGVKIDE